MPGRAGHEVYPPIAGDHTSIPDRQAVLSTMDVGVSDRVHEGLLFMGVVSAVVRAIHAAADDPPS